ncbi:acyl-CoA dehydrogenase family protein [Nesterenkonia muleiensis]|uniref:acyl-CoA dehydrogenase family protein n=1 Tax=Nesterenkonia muleiensis TaxID=2282648 RepID=UPI000E73A3CF|nr:acyl-CoA dehydrogenase family protein [Nesterenkonia muleiensis]
MANRRSRKLDLSISESGRNIYGVVREFVRDYVVPAEKKYSLQIEQLRQAGKPNHPPEILKDLTREARSLGLWNLFMESQSGLSQVDYAWIAEETGRSPFIAPATMNSLSPDSGNMEMLAKWANAPQRKEWLEPLLSGDIRSAFSMTEPDVASGDATNMQLTAEPHGENIVLRGRKWFTTGAADPRCRVLLVVANSEAIHQASTRHDKHSVLIVPSDTRGVRMDRVLPVFGFYDQQGHAEIVYDDVVIPRENVLGHFGDGFKVAQSRLGPGRVHHCMRAIGMAQRAYDLAVSRSKGRTAFGKRLADQDVLRAQLVECSLEIEQARLQVLATAHRVDEVGVSGARTEISKAKLIAPRMAQRVIDRSIQIHGAAGVTGDFPMAEVFSRARTLRIVDGPDEVHVRAIAKSIFDKPERGEDG